MLFVLFIHERHLDMFNKMSFLHKMCEALYHICHDVLECPTFHIRTNKSCCYSFNDIVVFLSLNRSPLMPEYKKKKLKMLSMLCLRNLNNVKLQTKWLNRVGSMYKYSAQWNSCTILFSLKLNYYAKVFPCLNQT